MIDSFSTKTCHCHYSTVAKIPLKPNWVSSSHVPLPALLLLCCCVQYICALLMAPIHYSSLPLQRDTIIPRNVDECIGVIAGAGVLRLRPWRGCCACGALGDILRHFWSPSLNHPPPSCWRVGGVEWRKKMASLTRNMPEALATSHEGDQWVRFHLPPTVSNQGWLVFVEFGFVTVKAQQIELTT